MTVRLFGEGAEVKISPIPRSVMAMSVSLLKFVGQASLVDEAMLPS